MKNWRLSEVPAVRDLELAPQLVPRNMSMQKLKNDNNLPSQTNSVDIWSRPRIQTGSDDYDGDDVMYHHEYDRVTVKQRPNVFDTPFYLITDDRDIVDDIPQLFNAHREPLDAFDFLEEPDSMYSFNGWE